MSRVRFRKGLSERGNEQKTAQQNVAPDFAIPKSEDVFFL